MGFLVNIGSFFVTNWIPRYRTNPPERISSLHFLRFEPNNFIDTISLHTPQFPSPSGLSSFPANSKWINCSGSFPGRRQHCRLHPVDCFVCHNPNSSSLVVVVVATSGSSRHRLMCAYRKRLKIGFSSKWLVNMCAVFFIFLAIDSPSFGALWFVLFKLGHWAEGRETISSMSY